MSDKTTAAIAAEQQAETPEAPAEALPAVTLDELEQVDLGTVEQGERAPFRITDDRCADWAIRKIAEERSEYNRLKELADQQKAAIEEKVEAARRRMENGTAFLTSCLADFFNTVPHKTTKTTEKYRLLSGTLTLKKGTVKATVDDSKAGAVAARKRLRRPRQGRGVGQVGRAEEASRLHRRDRHHPEHRRDRGGRHGLRDPGHLHGRHLKEVPHGN